MRTTCCRGRAAASVIEQIALFLEEATAEIGEAGAALARHWREAGERGRALQYALAAAEQAERGWAKELAVTLYRESLDLVADEDVEQRKRDPATPRGRAAGLLTTSKTRAPRAGHQQPTS